MPKKASGTFDQGAYVADYIKANIIYRKAGFNRNKPEDMALVEWLDSRPEGTAAYLKRLIREDMGRQTPEEK